MKFFKNKNFYIKNKPQMRLSNLQKHLLLYFILAFIIVEPLTEIKSIEDAKPILGINSPEVSFQEHTGKLY